MNEYQFATYEPEDDRDLLSLFFECFGKERSEKEWSWLYHDCPYGQSSIVCRYGGEVVGFYGVVIRKLSVSGDEVLSGHVLDVMTHPKHQGKGLFTQSARAAFGQLHAEGVRLVYGFPNAKALPGHRKVDWTELGTSTIAMCPIDVGKAAEFVFPKGAEKSCEAADLQDEKTRSKLERIAELWRSLQDEIETRFKVRSLSWDEFAILSRSEEPSIPMISPNRIIGDRSWKWLSWRYPSRPGFGYFPLACIDEGTGSLVGWSVLREREFEGKRVGHVIDYAFKSTAPDALMNLAVKAREVFSKEGCALMQCLENLANPGYGARRALWFADPSRGLPLIVRGTDIHGHEMPAMNRELWHLTLGDCDVF